MHRTRATVCDWQTMIHYSCSQPQTWLSSPLLMLIHCNSGMLVKLAAVGIGHGLAQALQAAL